MYSLFPEYKEENIFRSTRQAKKAEYLLIHILHIFHEGHEIKLESL